MAREQREQPLPAMTYVGITGAGLVISVALLLLYIYLAEKLVELGISGQVFYVLLVVLGFVSAVLLFGVMHAYGTITGNRFGGAFKLGGPIVATVLTVVGGFTIAPGPATFFDLTVRAVDEEGKLIDATGGTVALHLSTGVRDAFFGGNGEATLKSIPIAHRGEQVRIETDIKGYCIMEIKEHELSANVLELKHRIDNVDKSPLSTEVTQLQAGAYDAVDLIGTLGSLTGGVVIDEHLKVELRGRKVVIEHHLSAIPLRKILDQIFEQLEIQVTYVEDGQVVTLKQEK